MIYQLYRANQAATSTQSTIALVAIVESGDTLTAKLANKTDVQIIKLCVIQAPTTSYPLSQKSRERLQQLINQAQGRVLVWPIESNNSGSVIAEVYVSAPTKEQPEMEKLLNSEKLAAGLASIAEPSCYDQAVLTDIAAHAQAQKRGLWAASHQPAQR